MKIYRNFTGRISPYFKVMCNQPLMEKTISSSADAIHSKFMNIAHGMKQMTKSVQKHIGKSPEPSRM